MEFDFPQTLFWAFAVVGSLISLPPLFTKGAGHDFGGVFRWLGYGGVILTLCSSISSLSDVTIVQILGAIFFAVAAILGAATYLFARFGKPYDSLLAVTGLWIVLGVGSSVPIALGHFLFVHRRGSAFQILAMLLVSVLFERLGVFCEFEQHGRGVWDHRDSPFNHRQSRASESSARTDLADQQPPREEVPEITYEEWIAQGSPKQ